MKVETKEIKLKKVTIELDQDEAWRLMAVLKNGGKKEALMHVGSSCKSAKTYEDFAFKLHDQIHASVFLQG